MYNKILIPLDGSKRAERILPHVEKLAYEFNAELIFLQVVDPNKALIVVDDAAYYSFEEFEQITEEAKTYLGGLQSETRAKGIRAKAKVLNGPVVQTILNHAKAEEVDLIALASHGRTGLARVFYGSVAAGLLNRGDHPLFIIRAQD